MMGTNTGPRLRATLATALAISLAVPPSVVQAAEADVLSDLPDVREGAGGLASPGVATDAPSPEASSSASPVIDETEDETPGEPLAPETEGEAAGETPTLEEENETAGASLLAAADEGGSAEGGAEGAAAVPAQDPATGDAPAPLAEGDVAIDESSFPDAAFRSWILGKDGLGDIAADGVLTREERESVTGIHAQRCGIVSLKGIELFPNLRMIDVEGNHIERVDLSGNPELLSVYLRNNCLQSVDFSNNTKLEFVEVFDNQLSEVDLSMLPNLRFVHLDYNNLKIIDLSHNTKLEADGFVGNNNPLEKVVLPKMEGRSFDSFVISELDEYEGYTSTLPEWYTTPDFQAGTGITPSTVADRVFIPFDGQTLYVRRTPNQYTIRFDANGGEGSMAAVSRTWDDGLQALPESTFKRLGYRFLGWSADPAATTATFSDGQEVENVTGGRDTGMTLTLHAVWEPVAESSGYLRSQLNDVERAIYDDLASQLDKLTDPTDPSSVVVYVPKGAEGSLGSVLFAVLRDHPEYFWIDSSRLSWTDEGDGDYALSPRVLGESYFFSGFDAGNLADYRARFEARVADVVADAPSDPVLAVRYFNSWLADHNVYNPSGLGASNFSRTAASGLLSDNDSATGPVCYGYATAMKVLLDRAGIENVLVEGWARNGANGSGEQHAWNYVSVGGSWYAVDPTWNDPSSQGAPALETYLLVGSGTVTNPKLTGAETFGANHDPSRSPAVTQHGFSYPTLSVQACPEVATGLFEVATGEGSVRYDSLESALVAAGAGQTVRLWGDAVLDETAVVSRDLVLDLNGHGLSCSSAPALEISPGASLRLTNGAASQSKVESKGGAAVRNEGTIKVDPNVAIKGAGVTPPVQGAQVEAGLHAYVSTSNGSCVSYKVVEPAHPAAGEVDVAALGDGTVDELVAYVNGAGRPAIDLKFLATANSEASIPAGSTPAYSWRLVSAPGDGARSASLMRGTYAFETTVFDYVLRYEVSVGDAELDAIVSDGLARADEALLKLRAGISDGAYTLFDCEAAEAEVEATRVLLASVSDRDEARAEVEALLAKVRDTPTAASRAEELEGSWHATHGATLALVYDGSVSFENAAERGAAASAALLAAERDALASSLPEGMGEKDRALVSSMARTLVEARTDGLKGLSGLASAAGWAEGAAKVVEALPSPVTTSEVPALEGLVSSFDRLDPDVRALISSVDVRTLSDLLEAARNSVPATDPEAPVDPESPEGPVAPEAPADPESPVSPDSPEGSVDPDDPEAPADPVTPEDPSGPETPAGPDAPSGGEAESGPALDEAPAGQQETVEAGLGDALAGVPLSQASESSDGGVRALMGTTSAGLEALSGLTGGDEAEAVPAEAMAEVSEAEPLSFEAGQDAAEDAHASSAPMAAGVFAGVAALAVALGAALRTKRGRN